MKVSVNIVTYNAEKYIKECLGSVKKQTHPDIDILVIDSGSTDKTLEKIKDVKVIKNKENIGFSKAHNIGIKESKGEYVLCLNQDIVLDKDFLKNIVEAMEKNDKIGSWLRPLLGNSLFIGPDVW